VAIYRDENDDLQEEVVSLFEAVQRKNASLPIINKNHEKGWEFLFTMKQNELFVFANNDFDIETIDFNDVSNYSLIGKHCYRVQKFTNKDYWFRHHLETQINTNIKDVTFRRIQTENNLQGIIKIRVNHLGLIVQSQIRE
jgi:CRISPR-associated endonuclease Csn1